MMDCHTRGSPGDLAIVLSYQILGRGYQTAASHDRCLSKTLHMAMVVSQL